MNRLPTIPKSCLTYVTPILHATRGVLAVTHQPD
jgi:hypothetical protein